MTAFDEELVLASTKAWVETVVVALDLCPFAHAPMSTGRLRFHVSPAKSVGELKEALDQELDLLLKTPIQDTETSLLIHPGVLTDFLDYNDFLDVVDETLAEHSLVGTIQIASFHPDYCFGGSAPGDAANYTNRSPFPMLHLIRESSVSAAAARHPDIEGIPPRNMALLRELGTEEMRRRLEACKQAPGEAL